MKKPWISLLPGILLSFFGLLAADYLLLNHDAGSYLAFAEQYLAGKRFYKDLIDTNTPMITYLSLAPVLLHKATGLSTPRSFLLLVFLLLQYCGFTCWRLLRRHPLFGQPWALLVMTIGIYYCLFIGPNITIDFGQREHLFFALILPYLLLALNRLEAIDTPTHEARIVGILAGIGFSLKPHFLLLFVLTELFLLARSKNLRILKREEAIGVLIVSTVYYASMLILSPEYVYPLAGLFMQDYRGYNTDISFLISMAGVKLLMPVLLLLLYRQPLSRDQGFYLFFLLIVGNLLIYIIEGCNYPYHLLPSESFSILLFLYYALWFGHPLMYAGITALILFIDYPQFLGSHYANSLSDALDHLKQRRHVILGMADILRQRATGEPVAVLSSSVYGAFPAINYAEVPWGLSLSYLQYLPGSYLTARGCHTEPVYHSRQNATAAEQFFNPIILTDLEKLPALIIIDERDSKQGFSEMQFDFLHYFQQNPRFHVVWTHYRPVARFEDFAIFDLKSSR